MKKYLLIFFLFTFFSGCMDRAIDKRNLRICNKSIGMIYFFVSENDVFTNPYQDYSEEVLNANNCIRQDTSALYIDKPINWDEFIKNCKDGKMRVIIVSKDSIDKYGLKKVIFESIFTQKYLLDIDNLKK
ncbi:MAG TPA: hypothetical protein VFP20_05225 [Bacteroidales bacterium]|nr:hypothetical protein [Bacteroidales bacterium]